MAVPELRPEGPEPPGLTPVGQADTAVPGRRPSTLRYLAGILGPGLVTGAADDDPSGIATYSQTGAQFGYGQLWTALWMLPLITGVQEACGRIGNITGQGLKAQIASITRRIPATISTTAEKVNQSERRIWLRLSHRCLIHVIRPPGRQRKVTRTVVP